MEGLICEIYEAKDMKNCSNNGFSARFETVTLLGVKQLTGQFEPINGPFKPTKDSPPVIITERNVCGKIYYSAYPCNERAEALDGWYMFGGCFVKTCDSRFPFDYPIPLHDRKE